MKYLVLILTAAIAFSSCSKNNRIGYNKLECPAYNPTFLNTWFPYEEGHTYYYKSNNGERHWLAIQSINYSDGDEPQGCMIPQECIPSGNVFAYRDLDQYDKIWLSASHHISGGVERVTLAWNSTNIQLVVNDDQSMGLDPMYYERPEDYYRDIKPEFTYHSSRALNEVTYNDVYEITLNKNDMGNARKLYLVKNRGVIGYETQDGNTFWMER